MTKAVADLKKELMQAHNHSADSEKAHWAVTIRIEMTENQVNYVENRLKDTQITE